MCREFYSAPLSSSQRLFSLSLIDGLSRSVFRRVSGWQERWQIDYFASSIWCSVRSPGGIIARHLWHRLKRTDLHRWSSPVFLKPEQN
jgi:hypothetical protein